MAEISIIRKSDVVKAGRFDAEYFQPEYLKIEKKLENINNNFLYNIAKSNYKVFSPRNKDDFFDYIEISKVNLTTGEYEKQKILNKEQPSRAKKICNKFDLLISTVRPIRSAISLILEQKNNLVCSTGFCKLSEIKVNPYYLFVLLKTSNYTKLLDRETRATQYPAVSEDDILKLRIPIFPDAFQLEIEEIVKTAHENQSRSKKLYQEAEHILLEELGLTNYTLKHKLAFEIRKKEVDEAKRFDAEYFQPKYKKIIGKIKNYAGGFDITKNIVSWKKGIEVGSKSYTEMGRDFIRVSDFSIFGVKNSSKKISEKLFEEIKNNFQPRKGEILITKDGTIGTAHVLNKNIEGIMSSAFLRLSLKKQYKNFERECLALVFNSIICRLQIEQLSGGAIIEHLKPSDFGALKIPLIKLSVQKKIAEKIKKSHALRIESKNLLKEAKEKVEQEIEKQ